MKRGILLALSVIAGCDFGPADIVFYEVTSTRDEQCAIRSNGEFCLEEEEQFDPPVFTVWGIEDGEESDRLYVDEEVWVLDPLAEGEDPLLTTRTANRSRIITEGDGPCRATTIELLSFKADQVTFEGTFERTAVIDGPAACGETPVGERTVDDLEGTAFSDGDRTRPVGP